MNEGNTSASVQRKKSLLRDADIFGLGNVKFQTDTRFIPYGDMPVLEEMIRQTINNVIPPSGMRFGILIADLTLLTAKAGGFSVRRPQPARCEVLPGLLERIGGVSRPAVYSIYTNRRSPSLRMVFAALMSRSWTAPQTGHIHDRTARSYVIVNRAPHIERLMVSFWRCF